MKVHSVYIDEVTGQLVDVVTEEEIKCKEGQEEFCAICNHPLWPECMEGCVPYSQHK